MTTPDRDRELINRSETSLGMSKISMGSCDLRIPVESAKSIHRPEGKGSTLTLVATNKTNPAEAGIPSDEFLRTIIDACASNVAVLDESGSLLYTSQAWQAFWKANGVSVDFGDGAFFKECKKFDDQTPDEKTKVTLSDDIWRLRVGSSREVQGRYCYRGLHEPVHFVANAARLELPGSGFRVLISHEDILPPKEALRRNERRLSQLLEKTKIVAWEAEMESLRFTFVSEQAAKMFGYPLVHWYQPDFLFSRIHQEDREGVLSNLRKQSQTENQFDFTFRMIARNGKVVWVQNLVSVNSENGDPKSLRGFMIDVTERKCAEEALRDLGGRLITAQEEERSRVARELHDDLNQRMALLSIELEQLGQKEQEPARLKKRLKALQSQAQEISADLHRLSYKLHPSKLDHLGLGAAIKGLCQELANTHKLKVELRQKGFPADLPEDLTLCVFRVVQEALGNCVRHSGALAVEVVLEKTASAVSVSISDNGCGFDMDAPLMKKGLGFISMRERVRLVHGDIHVFSRPQRGTLIEVSVPVKNVAV